MKKKKLVLGLIILGIILIFTYFIYKPAPVISEQDTICIGENSELYVQTGCHACEIQEEMFGENKKYLNTTDCLFDRDKCLGIEKTPTWIINREKYVGVQTIDKLKELTNCK